MHKCAILGPTPGREHNPSMVLGMSLLYLSLSITDVPLMYFTLLCELHLIFSNFDIVLKCYMPSKILLDILILLISHQMCQEYCLHCSHAVEDVT